MAPWSCSASAMARTYCICFLLIARRLSASAWFAVPGLLRQAFDVGRAGAIGLGGREPRRGRLRQLSGLVGHVLTDGSSVFSDFGHEVILLQIWAEQDRVPPWDGELQLEDAETGLMVELAFDRAAREQYTAAFDAYAEKVRHVAERSGGRYLGLPTSVPVDQAIFGPLVNTGAVA